MRDVARAANVSVSAVSLVLRDRPGVAPETRDRVRAAVATLGYEVPVAANGRRQAIGLLIEKGSVPAILDIFYGDIVRGFQAEAQRQGYQVLLHMYDSVDETMHWLRTGILDEVRGVVVANDGDIRPDLIDRLRALALPIVLVESYVPDLPIPCILGDNFTAGYRATRHLLDLGHRGLAVLAGPAKYSSLTDRLRGCLAAAAEADAPIPPDRVLHPKPGHPRKGFAQGQALLHLAARPTAVVAVSDKTAFGAMEAIKEAGLRIPDEIAIASIDDVEESAHTRPPLTTVRIPRHEMGVLAMQKLRRLLGEERETPTKSVVYGELIVRESCGARRPHP